MSDNKTAAVSNNNFDVMGRVKELMAERGWSQNELARRAGIAQSTISSWFTSNFTPSVASIESLCPVFNITLSQFFVKDNDDIFELTDNQKEAVKTIAKLSPEQLDKLTDFLKSI